MAYCIQEYELLLLACKHDRYEVITEGILQLNSIFMMTPFVLKNRYI